MYKTLYETNRFSMGVVKNTWTILPCVRIGHFKYCSCEIILNFMFLCFEINIYLFKRKRGEEDG